MISRWRKSKRFKIAAYLTGVLQFAFPPFAVAAQNNGPQIVIDGRTDTNLVINQNITDVYTRTVLGSTGLNSFSIFNVFEGNEVNLYVPDGADALMNMVHDQQSVIDGYLNAYKNGKIGGDVYFLNPHGVLVGEAGIINVGRLSLQAPTQDFMRNMFTANGMINAPQVTKVLDNDMTLSNTGLISVRGQINATSGAQLGGGNIEVSGSVETGASAVVRIDNLVNLSGAMIDMDDVAPMVDLAAVNDIAVTGRIGADGTDGQQAGAVDVRAGGNITVAAGADISSDGQGLNSDGGTVIVMADNRSVLSAGAVISSDGGQSGDGGFVEFSARKTVELAGGQLSAAARDGEQGTILIDPEDIVISADLLRDSTNSNGGNSGGGTTWNAGALTLQADDSITINNNITVSSRHVANSSNQASHASGASTGDSGNIIFEADNITIGAGALVTAKADGSYDAGNITIDGKILSAQSGAEIDASNSGSGDAGTILFDADDRDNASIILSGASLRAGDITLDADAAFTPGGVYSNPTANANAEIKLSSSTTLNASRNITLNADATQNKAGYTSGVLVQFDARRADARIELNDVDLTATDNITIGSASTMQTDMTPTGWGQIGTLLPLNVAVAVTYSTSDIVIDGDSDVSAGEMLDVSSDAITQSTVTSQSNSVGAALVAAISVTENRSTILIDENANLSGADGVSVKTKGKSQITAIADASAGSVANLSGAIAIGVGITRDNTSTIIRDNASLTSTSGDVDILADSQVQTVFGARAGNDDNFTATAQSKFDAGIDDTPVLNQDFMGFNIGNFLKSGMSDQLNQVTSNMGNDGGSSLQLSGALTFSDIKNDTEALVTVLNPSSSTLAPSISAANGAIALKARSILQTQSMASGRSDNGSVGGSAGIGIQLVENRLTAKANGSDNAAVNFTSDDLTVAALTQAYEDNISDLNKYSVFASSGVGNEGDSDEVGIAGAIAIQVSNINDVTAEIGDNVTVAVDDNVTVTASNNTEVKVKADGSKGAQAASDRFFAVLDNSTPSEEVVKTNSTSGKLGIGASFAFAITENDVTAKIDGGATFSGTDNVSVIANQLSTTESEARSSGNGGIALVPVAAISVARNNALALIDSGATTLNIADKATISSTQDVLTTSVGNGAAATGGDASIQVAVGLSAGIAIGFDSNIAKLDRDLTVPGGLEIAALTSHDIQSGAQSSAEKVDPELIEDGDEPEESEENTADNATNNSTMDTVDSLLGTTNGQSGKVVNADAIKGKLNTNFADASGGSTDIGGPSDSDEGSAVAIAGAFGVTYAESEAIAEIAADVTVNAGSDNVSISSLKNTDMTSTGDASTSGSDYNIGGGVGLNIASSENTAIIRNGASITASGVSVNAGMRSQIAADNSTDTTNVIAASATSGSGTGEVAIAGAVALNVVLENDTTAKIADNASLTLASGDLSVEATATNSYDAASKATVGKEAGLFAGIDAALSGLQDITVWTSHLSKQFTNLTTSAVNKAYSEGTLFQEPGDGGGDSDSDSGGGGEGGFGLGAGISINAIVSEDTTAIIEDNVTFAGTGRVASARVAATSTTDMSTDAFAGAKPGAGNDPAAKTSLDAAVSVGVLLKDVDAYFGSQSTVLADGDVDVISTANTDSKSTAKGEVSASSTAVGASVAVSVVLETNEAEFNTDLTSYNGGGLTVQADSDSTDIVLADATAAGAALDKYSNKLGISKSDLLGSDSAGASNNDTPTSMSALNGDFSDGDSASYDLTGSNTATGENSGGEAQQSGSINIAASVGVNWADHKASAKIGGNVTIATDGDVLVEATNDANYRTRGSGMSVFSDKSIGVGVGLLKTGQKTQAQIGENVTLSTSGDDVNVRAVSSENQGTDPDNSSINFGGYASAEGIAGAGGGELGVAGSLALTFSYDSQFAKIGKGTAINSSQNVGVTSTATNKIVSRAWAMALASDATCKDPGNCNSSSGDKTAVGASLAINIVIDNNSAEIGENVDLSGTTDNVTVAARDLSPHNAEFLLDPSDNTTTTEDYLQANYTATLQNSSYYAEAIAGGAAQGGNAGTGALAVTVSVGKTEAIVGEGVQIGGDNFAVIAYNESDARNVLGAIALAEKKAIGASISGIYLREDVRAIVAENTDGDNADNVTVNISGDMSVTSTADQETLTLMAAGGVSANELALAGAFGFNVMDTDVEARIRKNADIRSTSGSVGVNATSLTDIRNFAIAVSGSGGSDSAGGSLALNLFLTDKKAIIGDSASNDNNISVTAADAVNVGVTAKQEILNGVISAAVSTSSNAISGALSANIVKGDSYALVQKGADINQDGTVSSSTQSVAVTADDNTTITDLTGTLAASSSTSIGVALAGNVFWKDVKAGINSRVTADDNVMVTADTVQNLTATTVGIAGSTGGFSGAGSVAVGLVKSMTYADIGSDAVIDTDGSVGVHAGDDTDIFMLEPAASFSAGGSALAGAVGAAVFIGTTKARILDNATITANGNESMLVEIDSTYTSSPLLDGIFGGGDDQTRDALADFNDNFTFDNIKDLFLTETRNTETRRGVAVSAVSDQDVISIAASGAVSSDNAIAISLSAGVGVNNTEASVASGVTINNDISSAHSDQDVIVRALSDTYWVDLSAALGVGTGTAGVGVGADVVVQVKNTDAFIAQNAVVKANRNVQVEADARDKVINSAATIGIGSTAGVAGTASVGVIVNDTEARIDGDVQAEDNISVDADATSELIQIAGAVGGGGTAGVGASFGIAVVKGETRALINNTAQVDAKGTTSVTADSTENSVAAVLAGGIGGTVGVSVSAGIKVHDSTTKARILGQVNQRFDNSTYSAQDVAVRATNSVTTIDVIGGIGGGGTVGVGVSLNALVVHNKAQASIEGAVRAERDISVTADSAKSTKNFTLAGAAGGTVSVAGNVAVLLVGAQADEETDQQMTGEGDNNLADEADSRNNSLIVSDIINDNASDGDYSRTGTAFSDVATEIDAKQNQTNIGTKFNNYDNTSSLNQTKAYISSSAIVEAGRDLTVESEDTTETIFTAGAIGGAGVVGVGVTVGVLLVNNTAEAYIGEGATASATRNMLVRARTAEDVNSGALSAGGAGITSVQGAIMAQVTTSKTRAYIADNASINSSDNSSASQDVAVLAESDTSLLSVTGSGGGALVGVGITGDAVVLDKETKAYIGDGASVASGGDIKVDAKAESDIIQVALSINGGLVGVTGSAGVIVAKNDTRAQIGNNALIYARDSVRLQSVDDVEVDGIVIAGAGGAVGVSGAFGVYVLKSVNKAEVGENTTITALAQGSGLDAADGTIDNSTTETTTRTTRDQDGNEQIETFTNVNATANQTTKSGVAIAAITNEDINLAPVGLGFGAVGVAGVVSVTTSSSTTEALVGSGTTINSDLTGVASDQDVSLLASSKTLLNNIASGISAGAAAVSLTSDTQVFSKTVRARMLGDANATRNMSVKAKTDDHILQTTASLAVGGEGQGGIISVSVVNDTVLAEIGDNSTVRVGNDLDVETDSDIRLTQSAGNVAGGAGGGVGASLGVLVAKSSNTARIGNNADVAVRRNLTVRADGETRINQNIIGFAGGMGLALSGSIGLNVLKTSNVAEIGTNAQINQVSAYNDNAAQSVNVIADDEVITQGAAGAAAIGGTAGIGIGLVATVSRNTVRATIGDGTTLNARDDVSVTASSSKDFHNTGIAFGGGVGVGAAGSVALTLIGGSMSDNASDTLSNDNGDMVADAASQSAKDRSEYETDDDSSNAKSNTNAYTEDDDAAANQLVMTQAGGLNNDIRGNGADSTRAEIGANVTLTASGDVSVEATETLELAQISGGASVGTVGVGGFVAVADYAGSVTARIGDNTVIDNVSSLSVDATIQSGSGLTIAKPTGGNLYVSAVNSTVIGASVGAVGLAAAIANVNLVENATAEIGDNVTVTTNDDDASITVDAMRDIDAEVNVVGVAGGVLAAGISYTGVQVSGNSLAQIGANSSIGTNTNRVGAVTIRARNQSTQEARAVSAGAAFGGALVGSFVDLDDTGSTRASVGSSSAIYSNERITMTAADTGKNEADAVGVAIAGGVGLSIISSDVDLDRDSTIAIGDNATVIGNGLSFTSTIGDENMSHRQVVSDTIGASGGLLVGATGSKNHVNNQSDANIIIGNDATVGANQYVSGETQTADNSTFIAYDYARSYLDGNAIAVGAAAIGAHSVVNRQRGGSLVRFDAGSSLDIDGNIEIKAGGQRRAQSELLSGVGGAIAANGGESKVDHNTTNKVLFADANSASERATAAVTGKLSLKAVGGDAIDSKIDASAIALAGITGGLAETVGTSNAIVRIGDYAEFDVHHLDVDVGNTFSKTGISGDHFRFDGGGGLNVTLGYADAYHNIRSKVEFGENSDVYVVGTNANQGHALIRAGSNPTVRTSARVSTGGAVSIPRSLAKVVADSETGIFFEQDALLATQRGDIDLRTTTSADIDAHSKTSVWGLAGVGASAQSRATLTSDEDIHLDDRSTVRANGYLRGYAGYYSLPNTLDVLAKADIYNNTLIAVNSGEKADARLYHDVDITVDNDAKMQSARHMTLRATKGNRNVYGDGYAKWLIFILFGVIPVDKDFGSSTNSASANVTIDGKLETGVFNEQFVGFGTDFGTFKAYDNGSVGRQNLVYDAANDSWTKYDLDNTSLGVVNVANGSWSDDATVTVKSSDSVTWTYETDQNLANDIDDEIARLNEFKAASAPDNISQGLINRRSDLQTTKNNMSPTDAPNVSYSQALADMQTEIDDLQTEIDDAYADNNTSLAQQKTTLRTQRIQERQDIIDHGESNFSPLSYSQGRIQAEIDDINLRLQNIGDNQTNQQVDTQIAFLDAKKAQLNQGQVDIIKLGDLYAATGSVYIEADNLYGSSGEIESKNSARIEVRNDSNSPLKLSKIEIPNDKGGLIYFNNQKMLSDSDISRQNRNSGTTNFTLTTNPGSFTSEVIVRSRFDPNTTQYNPDSADIKAPELLISQNIENRGGLVDIKNKYGSIFQDNASINAGELKLTSGGSIFIQGKDDGITNLGPHPSSTISYDDDRENTLGVGDIGTCSDSPTFWFFAPSSHPCKVQNPTVDSTDSALSAEGKIFVVANTVNLNGLVQSGIGQKNVQIANFAADPFAAFNDTLGTYDTNNDGMLDTTEYADNNNNGVFDIGDLTGKLKIDNSSNDGVFSGTGVNRELTGLFDAYFNADEQVVEVSSMEASGGEIFIAGKLISTGNGQLNVLDGYADYTINNQSGYDLQLSTISTGEVEGKITLIDNFKTNGDDLSKVTQYTRIGNEMQVYEGYGRPDTLNSAAYSITDDSNGSADRQAIYSPIDDVRYYWLTGEITEQVTDFVYQERTIGFFGHNFYSATSFRPENVGATQTLGALSADELPRVDYAAVPDTAESAGYTFESRYEPISRTQRNAHNGVAKDPQKSCSGWIITWCTVDVWTEVTRRGYQLYDQSLIADKDVTVRFIGSDTGSLDITSNAGIILNGNIENSGSDTRIIATGGDITAPNAGKRLNVGNITIESSGSIGTAANALNFVQPDNATITASANGGVFMTSEDGNLIFDNLTNTGNGDVVLFAGEDLRINTDAAVLRGNDIDLTAEVGAIVNLGTGDLLINTVDNGTLSALSRSGNIEITETSQGLRVKRIDAIGNVSLTVSGGDITDANAIETDDTAAQATLLSLWNDLELTGDAASDKKDDQIDAHEAEMTLLYNDYWELRNVQENSDGDYIAEAYDPNFTYEATADERSALNDNATAIAAFEGRQQARYQLGYEKFGNGSYDDNFTYVATADEIDTMTAGFEWDQAHLEAAMPGAFFKETTDTTTAVEEANIIGDNITLTVTNGNIGAYGDVDNFTLDAIRNGTLDNSSKILLAAAESDDMHLDNETEMLTITQREDLDIETRYADSVVNIDAQDGFAFVGGEGGLNINSFTAGGEGRLKVNGDLFNVRIDNNTVFMSNSAIIEAADGQIGNSTSVFKVDIADGYNLTARAMDGIWITEATNDINVSQLYSPANINLTSPGRILDALDDTVLDVKAQDVTLIANGSIGEQPADNDTTMMKIGKALEVASINYDNSTFSVTSATDGAWLFGPLGENLRMTGADLAGVLDVAVGANLRATGSFDTDGNDITFRSFESLNLEGVGSVDTNGALLNLLAGNNLNISGSISTGGGNVFAQAADNMTIEAGTSLNTGGGNLTIDMDNLLNQNITFEDTAVVNVGSGITRIEASDTVTLTGLVSTNDNDCLPNQQGCAVSVLASRIQDAGDTNADIKLDGNGDVRLNVHEYANLNKLDYNGSDPLQLYIQGKNEGARAVGAMLGIEAEAGIDVQRLYANSAAFDAPLTESFDIIDGKVRDDIFITAGDFDARIGRLANNSLTPNDWLLSLSEVDYFSNGAVIAGERAEDYRCTGNPSYIGDANSVLNVNFSYANPNVDCSGVLTFYRLPFVLVNPEQSSQQVLGNFIESAMRSSTITIDPVSTTRLTQSILSTNRAVQIAAGQAVEVSIEDVARNFGIADETLASEFAETFTVREPTALGVVQINPDNLIQIGLPLLQDVPLGDEPIEPGEEPAEAEDEPTDTVDEDTEEQPIAANEEGEDTIGPLSLLDN